jgi:hypothetical protein
MKLRFSFFFFEPDQAEWQNKQIDNRTWWPTAAGESDVFKRKKK